MRLAQKFMNTSNVGIIDILGLGGVGLATYSYLQTEIWGSGQSSHSLINS